MGFLNVVYALDLLFSWQLTDYPNGLFIAAIYSFLSVSVDEFPIQFTFVEYIMRFLFLPFVFITIRFFTILQVHREYFIHIPSSFLWAIWGSEIFTKPSLLFFFY